MNYRITVQRPSTTTSSLGEPTRTFTDLFTIGVGDIRPISGIELTALNREVNTQMIVMDFPYSRNTLTIQNTDTLNISGNRWEIVNIAVLPFNREFIRITAERRN